MRRLLIAIGLLLTLLTFVLARGHSNTFEIETTHTDIELPDLPPEFDGYRIALISCIHTDRFARREQLLRDILQEIDTDLLVVAGDFRRAGSRSNDAIESCRQIFEGLSFPDGIVAGMGNHDRHWMFEPLRRMGVQILFNDCFTVTRPALTEADLGGPSRPTSATETQAVLTFVVGGPAYRRNPNWDRALGRAPPGAFLIGICHSPDGVVSAAKRPIPLLLCGHTHGGQIRLPGIGPLITETRLVGHEYASGLCRFENTLMYVNRGIGWTGLPLRFNCPPEVSILTLRRPAPDSSPVFP